MQYIDLVGDYASAYADVLQHGGQLYPGNGKDSANVIVRGKTCYTYWAADSKRKQQVIELCNFFNISPEGRTGGRICRWLLEDLLLLPYQGTFWQKNWRMLAKGGSHWHYATIQPKRFFWGCEFDIKSAYFSSLFSGKTLLWDNTRKWMDDGGALESLKVLNAQLPKWFRLQLLGTLASWKNFFLCRDSSGKNKDSLIYKTRHSIKYNASFNCAHRAILRNYKIMKRVHEIGKEFIMRMHTDSFTLSIECPVDIEMQIFDYLSSKGLECDIKSAGYGYFFDLNCGWVGRKFIGARVEVLEHMREHEVKMKKDAGAMPVLDRFGERLSSSSFDVLKQEKKQKFESLEGEQENLFNVNLYGY